MVRRDNIPTHPVADWSVVRIYPRVPIGLPAEVLSGAAAAGRVGAASQSGRVGAASQDSTSGAPALQPIGSRRDAVLVVKTIGHLPAL